ncbi:MAG: hypothetical protein IT175_09610 [Acidobacteria bacterium]|nr:hypothetical protein [Acidobacteriota bacterium]
MTLTLQPRWPGGTKPPSESEVVNHEIGYALHFVENPIQVANTDAEDLEPTANGFAKKVENEKNSMSEPDAKK